MTSLSTPQRAIDCPQLTFGWLLPHLLDIEDAYWGRWDYWASTKLAGRLLDQPIPKISYSAHPTARKHLESCLNAIPNYPGGSWKGWSASTYVDFFLQWVLYGLGHADQTQLPSDPPGCLGAGDRLVQLFDIEPLIRFPYDYIGDLLSEACWGRLNAFFPTPMQICEFSTQSLMADEVDSRCRSMIDPCCGTGRMLLSASNFTLICYGIDISHTAVLATLFNCALYAPWVYRPLAFLETR